MYLAVLHVFLTCKTDLFHVLLGDALKESNGHEVGLPSWVNEPKDLQVHACCIGVAKPHVVGVSQKFWDVISGCGD